MGASMDFTSTFWLSDCIALTQIYVTDAEEETEPLRNGGLEMGSDHKAAKLIFSLHQEARRALQNQSAS